MVARPWSWIVVLSLVLPAAPAAAVPREPTEQEQYMIELVNRARLDPAGEVARYALGSLNEGSPTLGGEPWTIPAGPHQPLAPNPALVGAGFFQAETLEAADEFCHECLGTTVVGRIASEGYATLAQLTNPGGVANYTGLYGTTSSGFVPGRENLALHVEWPADGIIADLTARVADAHEGLFVDTTVPTRGHRSTMMYGEWKEIGVGIDVGTDLHPSQPGPWDSLYIAVEFAHRSDTGPFVTGVVYEDVDGDQFYTPDAGEALGGILVEARVAGTQTLVDATTTFASGGYALDVGGVGSYDVRFTGPGIASTVYAVQVAAGPEGVPENTKVDLVVPEPRAAALGLAALASLGALAARRARRRA